MFLKAVSAEVNADSPELYRREARVSAALPAGAPAPTLLWVDEKGPWVALAFEEVAGRPPRLPWQRAELNRVLDALHRSSRALTPSPMHLPPFAQAHRTLFGNWNRYGGAPGAPGPVPLGPWVRARVRDLARLEAGWARASVGPTLLHCDIREDNVLLTPRRVYFVDWPWACVGAPWIDLLLFLPSVAMQGGPPPWELFDPHPLAREAPPTQVDALLTALAGFFLFRGAAPPPPGLPSLRRFQWEQGRQVIRWLRHRWEEVDMEDGGVPAFPFRPSGPSASPSGSDRARGRSTGGGGASRRR